MKKRQLPQKQQQQRGKRILLASLIALTALATLTSLVFALQHDLTARDSSTIDRTLDTRSPFGTGDNSGRANIYDRNFNELAVNSHTTAVYVRPLKLRNTRDAAEKLAPLLALDKASLLTRLKAEKGFIWIARHVTPHTAAKIADLKMKGVYLKDEIGRRYPNGSHGAHIVGFANSEQGLDGVEYFYDNIMHDGPIQRDSLPEQFTAAADDSVGAQGVHLVLTVDLRIQKVLERYLATAIKKSAALTGSAAIVSVESGAVLALANQPTFDPNRFWDFSNQDLRNRFINDRLFSGDLQNFFQQAAQFEEIKSLVRTTAKQSLPESDTRRNSFLVPCNRKKKIIDQDSVVASETLPALFKQLPPRAAVSMDLPQLNLNPIENARTLERDRARVTGLQLLADFCSLANGGKRLTPHLLDRVWDRKSGRLLSTTSPPMQKAAGPNPAMQQLLRQLGKKGPVANTLLLESVIPLNSITPLQETLTAPDKDHTHAKPVNYQLLGLLSSQGQSLAMIIALNNVDLSTIMDTSGKDSLPMSLLDSAFFNRTMQWAKAPPGEPTSALQNQPRQLLPIKSKKTMNRQPGGTGKPSGSLADMPEVIGKSLRSGLQTLQLLNLRISVVGSGLIIAQQPNVGAEVMTGDQCILQLQRRR